MTDYQAPPPPPYQQGYPPQGYGYVEQKKHGGFATAALVLGILGLIFSLIPIVCYFAGFPCDVLAVIFGGIAWKGWGKAKAGLILGVVGLVAAIAWTVALANAVDQVSRQFDNYNACTNHTPLRHWDRCDKYLN